MPDRPTETPDKADELKEITQHTAFFNEFDRTGKIFYGAGVVFLLAAVIYWGVQLFFFFTEFHKKGILDLLLAPIIKFIANPLLWISIVLFKISQRYRQPENDKPGAI